jgi:hypothetical protein
MSDLKAMTSNNEFSVLVDSAIQRLDSWLTDRNWQGYDPYDLRAGRFAQFLKRQKSSFGRRWASRVRRLCFRHPALLLRLSGHQPREVPKAMGLFMSAYARLQGQLGEEKCHRVIKHCADWLLAHPSAGYPGTSWGYPFDWQSAVFVPKGTPSIVVSCTVGEGFLDAYRMTGDGKYLDVARDVCKFITTGLNVTTDQDTACFSYTPLDHMCVHNANLMGAAFLLRVGDEVSSDQWQESALKAAEFTLRRQNDDGSFYYSDASSGQGRLHRDIYHSGFEIRALYQIWKLTSDARYYEAVRRYLEFYRIAYIRDDGAPTRDEFRQAKASFDIHGCAESILCPSTLLADFPELATQLQRATAWTCSHMSNPDGSWAYFIDSRSRIDRMPYIRWGQAWMLRALAQATEVDIADSVETPGSEEVELCGLV